jgi:hypothetical protein
MEGALFLGPLRKGKINFLFRGILMRVSRDLQKCPVSGSLSP